MRILIAEDERDLNRLIVKVLEKEGYGVDACFNGKEALYYLENTEYDAAVLDIMMPGMDGLEVLRAVRKKGLDLPIMFLTARDSIADRVTGLDTGADDYLIKPFDFDELLARIRSMTRKRSSHTSSVLTVGNLTLDTGSHTARRGDRVIDLSAREYAILEYLCMNPGIVLSREKIENHIWNYDYSGGTNVVDVYISYLRKKIDGGCDKKLIRTVWGAGWMIKEAE
ncbi:MAG TPA: response regulator transcription factor [Candidatus Lachnoclostridium stercoripullorum]|uniref:Stage 0 sporulation protein A homolog n=1 Tax=Candidatus Lachnoclostridium stercoripullorum TaxID=2838635 RepID=A0A9D1W4F8_9FIRM|nr:response regulator transcription factor [Candidatus Lachnoclostridium stercoripullorum]